MSLWLAARPLVLASKSAARRASAGGGRHSGRDRARRYRRARGRGARRPRRCRRWPRRCWRGRKRKAVAANIPAAWCSAPTRRWRSATRRFSKAPDRAAAREQLMRLARQDPYAAFRRGGGGGRRGRVRARRCRAADDARVFGWFSRRYLDAVGAPRPRASAAISSKARASNCSSASRAIISPCSACRCCRCWIGCGARAICAK